jgi:hypothetical protein
MALGAELERVRLEPGCRGFELGKVHFFYLRVGLWAR